MIPTIARNLVAYSCGLSLIALCALLAASWSRVRSPRLLLTHYQAAVLVAALLPLATLWRPVTTTATGLLPAFSVAAGSAADTRTWPSCIPAALLAIAGAGMVMRLLWLVAGAYRLRRWRTTAVALTTLPEAIDALERRLNVRARWFVTDRLSSAATYGIWRPVVLLPARDINAGESRLTMVVRHELIHVKRRDWLFAVAEECLLAVLWMQPAVWCLIDRIRLHREQVVDAVVISETRDTHGYTQALLAGAGLDWTLSPRPASQWLRRRHLRLRIHAISDGGHMSRVAQLKWSCAFAATLMLAGYSAVQAFPLQNSSGASDQQHVYSSKDPGIVLPGIVKEVKPQYTQEAIDAHIEGRVILAVVVDATGAVTDVQITESLDPTFGLDNQAVAAAWQWRFSPATKDGKAVAVSVALELRFTLK